MDYSYGSFVIQSLSQYIDTPYVLIVQRDGFISNPFSWNNTFLNYDYIGARWPIYDNDPKRNREDRCVGNGGFSIRSKKLLDLCSKNADQMLPSEIPEDLLICIEYRDYFEQNQCLFAPIDLADAFSAEYTPYSGQFGFHGPGIREILYPKYPDLNVVNQRLVTMNKYSSICYEYKDMDITKPLVIYRISDGGYSKNKPPYINNRNCLTNFMNTFKPSANNLLIIADNITDETYKWLSENVKAKIILKTSFGSGGASFRFALGLMRRLDDPTDQIYVYFVEDDYLHMPHSSEVLMEGLKIADYVTLYDHPDKYMKNGPNPLVHDGSELTRVYLTKSCHWKKTNSGTMTFATKLSILKKDLSTITQYVQGNLPLDYPMFCELVINRGRQLISAIPSYSTHGETDWLSPIRDWKVIAESTTDFSSHQDK